MSTPAPSTAAPTYAPQTPAQTNSMIWAVIIVIIACLVGVLMCLMCCHHARAVSQIRKIKLDILDREMQKVNTEMAAAQGKPADVEALTKRGRAIYEKAARLHAQRSIFYELDDAVVVATGNSKESSAMYEIAFHTSVGRTAAVSFMQLNSQINSVLNFVLSLLIHEFIQDEIVRSGANERRAQLQSISITFFIMLVYGILNAHFARGINLGMGANTDIFYEKPKDEIERDILESLSTST
jgi:hypothetical protein